MLSKELIDLLFLPLLMIFVFGAIFLIRHFVSGGSCFKDIIEAEKKRQAHPDAQNGQFTRLYTMPYYEDLDGEHIRKYCDEHLPNYHCRVSKNKVTISETRTGLSGEVRELYITHLKEHNISAIDFSDPIETEYTGRYGQTRIRSGLYDKGFSKNLREMIRTFQQKAVSQQHI